ncbi:MAG: YggT family protein [Candidatus Saccharimonadales bacterium]
MSDIKRTVTRSEESGLDDDGASVQQETKRVHTESAVDGKTTAQNVVWFVLGVIEVALGLRFVLKLLGANTTSSFVDFIYSITKILTAPFDSIFGVTSTTTGTTHSVFEPSIVVAGIVYALIAWGIVKLITINQKP